MGELSIPSKLSVVNHSLTFASFIAASRVRAENVRGRVSGPAAAPLPSGDDVFGPALDDDRLALIDTFCDALNRKSLCHVVDSWFDSILC